MLEFIRYIKGYVCIAMQGYAPERFMNLCRNNGIILWDIVPGEQIYYCKAASCDYKRMKPFIRKTNVRASIVKKHGLPFLIQKNRKRKIFFMGIPVCLLFLYVMTGYLWAFDFQGNLQVSDDMLYAFCEEENVRIGSKISKIDIEGMERDIRERFECVTWVSVTIKGTRLLIAMNENDLGKIENQEDTSQNADILAQQDGTILHIVTRNGVPKVKKGDSVTKGEILVEGSVPVYDNDGNIIRYEYCSADADILLQCQYPVSKRVSRYYCYKHYIGRQIQKKFLRIGEKIFSCNIRQIKYPNYDVVKEEKQGKLYQDILFPVFWGRLIYREYVEIDALYSDEAAKELLNEFLNKKIKELNEKGVQIIENNVKIEKTNDNVGIEGYLTINLWNQYKQPALPKEIEHQEQESVNE